jgi:hypothetical protein
MSHRFKLYLTLNLRSRLKLKEENNNKPLDLQPRTPVNGTLSRMPTLKVLKPRQEGSLNRLKLQVKLKVQKVFSQAYTLELDLSYLPLPVLSRTLPLPPELLLLELSSVERTTDRTTTVNPRMVKAVKVSSSFF